MTDSRRLIEAYLDGELTPDMEKELQDWLRANPENPREFARAMSFHRTLRDELRARTSVAAPRARRRIPWWMAGAVAAAALVGVGVWWFRPSEVSVARLDRIEGTVRLVNRGTESEAESGADVLAGRGIATVGPRSSASLTFPDGTRVALSGDTFLGKIDDGSAGKHIFVGRGTISARVSTQPQGRPMVFTTPQGTAKVVGTTLRITVDAAKAKTRLDVEEGKVLLANLDGKSVEVISGHFAVAAPGAELVSKPRSAVQLMFGDGTAKTEDTYVYALAPNENFGGRNYIQISPGNPAGHALVRFPDLIGTAAGRIAPKSVVPSATLRLKCLSNGPGTLLGMTASRSIKAWSEGRGTGGDAWAGEATWTAARKDQTPWEVPGGLGASDRAGEFSIEANVDANGFVAFEIAPAVQAWANGELNQGLILVHSGASSSELRFASSEDADPANRPLLTVSLSK